MAEKVIGLGIVAIDITERIEAEQQQRLAWSRFETGFEQAGIGAAILDLEGFRSASMRRCARFSVDRRRNS
jgi:hypothetical protein